MTTDEKIAQICPELGKKKKECENIRKTAGHIKGLLPVTNINGDDVDAIHAAFAKLVEKADDARTTIRSALRNLEEFNDFEWRNEMTRWLKDLLKRLEA